MSDHFTRDVLVPVTVVAPQARRSALSNRVRHRFGIGLAGLGACWLISVMPNPALANKNEEAAQALRQGNDAVAVDAIGIALGDAALGNEKRAILLTERGVARVRLQQFRLALDDLNRAALLYPEYPAVYINRGNLLLVLGQPQEAIRDFDRAMLLAPNLAAVFTNRAAAYLKSDRLDLALADYSRAIELNPRDPVVLSGRGRAHLSAGRPHAAIRDFSRAADLNASFGQAYRNRAEARMMVEQYAEAASDLSRALAFDSTRTPDYLTRGQAYLAAGNAAAALKDFGKVVETQPRSIDGYLGRSLAHTMIGSYDEALDDITRAVELEPKVGRIYAIRAYVYTRTQQPSLAERDVELLQKLMPGSADLFWIQGEIEEAYGRGDTAIVAYRKALSVDRRHRYARAALQRLGAGDGRDDQIVAGPVLDGWKLVSVDNEFWALNEQFPKVRAMLEMAGIGQPKILGWERKKPPHSGFGVLRYAAGSVVAGQGSVVQENVAVLDVTTGAIVGVAVAKLGGKDARFDWGDGQLSVAGADGLSETFRLTTVMKEDRDVAAVAAPRKTSQLSGQSSGESAPKKTSGSVPSWSPWANTGPSAVNSGQQREAKPKAKPKSIFDMLFGN